MPEGSPGEVHGQMDAYIGLGLSLETMAGLEGGTIAPALLDDSIMGRDLSASRAVVATAGGLVR
ncbi:unnamed protein product [Clonostachys byssicola]|uniref:Uncharacterized protein n=1 Tax=Clonostachys byssicola TaxID=160290 RepID=A0A9N9U2X8_9HYPO|nr:unnamed protein product [Clonostachys byssicola]